MIWSPLTMTYTDDNGRVIGKIEEVERPDRWSPDVIVMKYSATWFGPRGHNVGGDYDTWQEAQAMIEKFAREERVATA